MANTTLFKMMTKYINTVFFLVFPILLLSQSTSFIDKLNQRTDKTFILHLHKLNKICKVDTVLGIADQNGNNVLIWRKNNHIYYSKYVYSNFKKRRVRGKSRRNRVKKLFGESVNLLMYNLNKNFNYSCQKNIRICRYLMIKSFHNGDILNEISFFVPENWNDLSDINSFIFLYFNIVD